MRGIRLCLLAHSLGGGDHYLAFARDYAGLWADVLLAEQELPVGLGVDGPLFALRDESEAFYLSGLGRAAPAETPVDRAENFPAAGGINAFLELWELTGDTRFLRLRTPARPAHAATFRPGCRRGG